MKKILIPILLIAIIIAVPSLSGCKGSSLGKDVITETKDVADFTTLDIGSAFEVDIQQSDTFSVTIHADESLINYIEVTRTGTNLKLYLNPRHIFTDFTLGDRVLRADITMPNLYGLNISGASKGKVSGFASQANLDLTVSGATTLDMVNITAGNVNAVVDGASTMTGNLTAANVDFEVSGASTLELTGSGNMMMVEVSGASKANLVGFPARVVSTDISGASRATIFVEELLNVKVSGASSLYFDGNPTLGTTDVSGASTIKHTD